MNDNYEHPWKQKFPIKVAVFGIEMGDNAEHFWKRKFPIEVTVFELKWMIMINIFKNKCSQLK
jgi:hypothetical protein